jgi:ribonuclease HI/uncharacterized phage-like protein YoqJ
VSGQPAPAGRQTTAVYTDGACLGNPGPGGWAWAVPEGGYCSGADPATTNQRMEIRAALEAVTSLPGRLEVVSDSTYVVNCFRDRWWEAWLARNWVNRAKKPIANRDLWEPLIDEYRADPTRLRFSWVKGHSNDRMNDLVDRLAVEAAETQQGRQGNGPPSEVGPADQPGRPQSKPDPGSPADWAPEGHLVLVTGLKPPNLGGYGDNPVAESVRRRLTEILTAKRALHPDLSVLTGLGLGTEQLAAEAAVSAGAPYVAVLPFPGVDEVWPAAGRQKFALLIGQARQVITLQHKKPESRQAAGGALARRDAWLARHAAEAIAVWDGEDAAIGRAVRSLQDHLGEEDVWVLEPAAT